MLFRSAGAYETLKLLRGDTGLAIQVMPLVVGMLAAAISGLAAIAVLLRFLRANPTTVFVVYRLLLACVIVAWWLAPGR